jgi:hypothetical protein
MSESKSKKTPRRPARDILRSLAKLFDSYRPEQHYMRGPGPKWREQHPQTATASTTTIVFGPEAR